MLPQPLRDERGSGRPSGRTRPARGRREDRGRRRALRRCRARAEGPAGPRARRTGRCSRPRRRPSCRGGRHRRVAREAQSTAFFRTPGMEPLYSGRDEEHGVGRLDALAKVGARLGVRRSPSRSASKSGSSPSPSKSSTSTPSGASVCRRPGEGRVVRPCPEAAGDGEEPHRSGRPHRREVGLQDAPRSGGGSRRPEAERSTRGRTPCGRPCPRARARCARCPTGRSPARTKRAA